MRKSCIPRFIEKSELSSEDVNEAFYLLFYRIEEMGLVENLIHIDEKLAQIWIKAKKEYNEKLDRLKDLEKLISFVKENFDDDRIRELSNTDSGTLIKQFKEAMDND